jgi:hypothetical protein
MNEDRQVEAASTVRNQCRLRLLKVLHDQRTELAQQVAARTARTRRRRLAIDPSSSLISTAEPPGSVVS